MFKNLFNIFIFIFSEQNKNVKGETFSADKNFYFYLLIRDNKKIIVKNIKSL